MDVSQIMMVTNVTYATNVGYANDIKVIKMNLKKAATKLINAWESLDSGNHSIHSIQHWLVDEMKPAMDDLRKAIQK